MRPATHARAVGRARGTWGPGRRYYARHAAPTIMPRVRAACGLATSAASPSIQNFLSFFLSDGQSASEWISEEDSLETRDSTELMRCPRSTPPSLVHVEVARLFISTLFVSTLVGLVSPPLPSSARSARCHYVSLPPDPS